MDTKKNGVENEYNEEEDKSCPFCQYFQDSPCRNPFRQWRICVKNVENPIMCMDPFVPLKQCMDDNGMIFESPDDNAEDIDSEKDV
eukprot:CAMPEP_0198248638 /NCGR_PEP_ID=MMETSP1447-20131203/381_1 /TAXON_ID=420782 /ORGANISM="Chaetoceros dichaeta, Strain CCMP1751" /LENGTH=85 /DNA_ID=CAMNT_0043933101 /DNA_START=225 /DNA_END=482 /DNA_ORIENTATION=-